MFIISLPGLSICIMFGTVWFVCMFASSLFSFSFYFQILAFHLLLIIHILAPRLLCITFSVCALTEKSSIFFYSVTFEMDPVLQKYCRLSKKTLFNQYFTFCANSLKSVKFSHCLSIYSEYLFRLSNCK